MSLKVLIAIPTYNERENLEPLLSKLLPIMKGCHVLVIDDNSPDGTTEFIKHLNKSNIHLLSRRSKMGLGSAYLDGFRWALDNVDPDVIIQMDADFSHDMKVIPMMTDLIQEGYDLVVASRYIEGGEVRGWSLHRNILSKGVNAFARVMLSLQIRDATSGFKAWSKRALKNLLESNLSSKGFEYQIESILVASKANMKIIELPYTFVERKAGKSKLSFKDSLDFAISILRMAYRR